MTKSILLGAALLTSVTVFSQNLKPVAYQDGSQKLNGLVTSNAGKKLPGVLILPAWKGIDDEAKTLRPNLRNRDTLLLWPIFTEREIFLPTIMQLQKLPATTRKIMRLTRKGFPGLGTA
uniref:Uncharacterized protein n=1 Tax=Chryseobacterium endophyticum TaxID=1854762 RepID=A0AAU6WLD2_9FLAO